MIHIYTGDGKGKTTAAFGLALRAAGHGKKVKVIQFMKGYSDYGENIALESLDSIAVEQFGREEMVDRCSPSEEDRALAHDALSASAGAIRGGTHDMVILDEINVALDFGLIDLESVLELVRTCPGGVEIVLTGRNAPEMLVEIADYVTEMMEIKHPYKKGIKQRKGIEY